MDAFTIFAAVMYSILLASAALAALTPNKRPLSKLFHAANRPSKEDKRRAAEAREDSNGDGELRGT